MWLTKCLFLQLAFYATCSNGQRTAANGDNCDDDDSKFLDIRHSVDRIQQSLELEFQSRLQERPANVVGCVAPKSSCPPGFNYSVKGIPKCYAVDSQLLSWDSARTRCSQLHPEAQLVTINSALENQVLSKILEKHECRTDSWNGWFWTGGRRMTENCSSTIVWKPNSRIYQALDYDNFCPHEPDCTSGLRQYCLSIVKDCWSRRNTFGWQDDVCSYQRCAICEIVKFD